MKHITSRQIALNGLVAGLYAAVTILTASFAYGNIQFRLAEALCLLVALEPTLTVGLTLGCLIANLFSTVSALDIIVGTAATLLACLLTRYIKNTWLLPLPTILCNMLMVGAMLSALYMPAGEFWKGLAIFGAEVGAISDRIGRGRHTTRHVELHPIEGGGYIADTPGFSSFETEQMDLVLARDLEYAFPEFAPYLGQCRFTGCAHVKEKGCAILAAVENGEIAKTRHESYVKLYESVKDLKEWELTKGGTR